MEHSIVKKLEELAEKTALEMDDELVELTCTKSDDGLHIEVIIYNAQGTSLDHCVEFSRAYDKKVEELNISDGTYFIEVASPGLDRPIKTDDDLRRNLGNKVGVRLYKKINSKKDFIGEILDYSKEEVVIGTDSSEEKIPREAISLMRQVIEF